MALSEEERRLLEDLERHMRADDPALVRELETGKAGTPPFRIAVLSIGSAVVGLVLLLIGLTSQLLVISVPGLLLLAGGLYWLMTIPPLPDQD
ncbi:DUF3040 domain-containing protein [Arthrobacter sp. USHLN218]|uniref:DUF3040 domain-containing protein n=1 Tax=Arthrobacter sp. USHLN218 TaxID=3081232 RepID=UPI00301A0DBD